MKRLRIEHRTTFSYAADVAASYNEARMTPAVSDAQLVIRTGMSVSPVGSTHSYTDYWGTGVTAFEVLTPHRELSVLSRSVVEVRPATHSEDSLSWEELEEASRSTLELVEQCNATRLTAPPEEVARLATEIASSGLGPGDAALAIARTVGDAVDYVPGVTGVHSTAAEAWVDRKGVCQDIAHITLGALRSVGIPARYVSGYLHPQRDPVVGETIRGESHAWVEWFCGQWRGYDPTNSIEIGDRHVLVGRGRDYSDVPPLRGVFAGSRSTSPRVTVEITRES
ncbi:transglutaminase family protein [Planctomonas psychrotolerans]|uniref:transglutaminase family protein n=1 Tax=Planctomonas psychrotolerans TaxID=2528712 RepID=UPI00123B3D4A|nr:transglutaminase family protein [Planctomonas psychrotolerans]